MAGYSPVANTEQVTDKVTVLLAGKAGSVAPAGDKKSFGVVGQVAPPLRLAMGHVTRVHNRPALELSLTIAPSAASGPALLATTV